MNTVCWSFKQQSEKIECTELAKVWSLMVICNQMPEDLNRGKIELNSSPYQDRRICRAGQSCCLTTNGVTTTRGFKKIKNYNLKRNPYEAGQSCCLTTNGRMFAKTSSSGCLTTASLPSEHNRISTKEFPSKYFLANWELRRFCSFSLAKSFSLTNANGCQDFVLALIICHQRSIGFYN